VCVVLFDGFTCMDAYGPIQAFQSALDSHKKPLYHITPVSYSKRHQLLHHQIPSISTAWTAAPSTLSDTPLPVSSLPSPSLDTEHVRDVHSGDMSNPGIQSIASQGLWEVASIQPDVLVVPGGYGTRSLVHVEPFIQTLKSACLASKIIFTVCTGSALVARTGLLDHQTATSNKMAWDWVLSQGQHVNWVRKARWVNNIDPVFKRGIISSAGVFAGTDAAFELISVLHGRNVATEAARRVEYMWNSDSENDPFA